MTDAARPPLTAETILALPAGVELDFLIHWHFGLPRAAYSTSWEAMGEVVAKLRAGNDHVDIQFERGSPCSCDVRRHTYQGPDWSATALDAPEAVAKAALLSTL